MKRLYQFILTASLLFATQQLMAASKASLAQLYPQGGATLFCQTPFSSAKQAHFGHIYNKRKLLGHFNCITADMCKSNKTFQQAFNDLHDIYPVTSAVQLERRNAVFGNVLDTSYAALSKCGYYTGYQLIEPGDDIKGNIARILVYMIERYSLPILGDLETYKKWNKMDPPDATEKRRNQRVKAIQGNANPYVTHPNKMNDVHLPQQATSSWMNIR